MEYTFMNVADALFNYKKRDIGFDETEFATHYEIPVFWAQQLISIVKNKQTNQIFLYCNGKKVKPDYRDSTAIQSVQQTAVRDQFDALEKFISCGNTENIYPLKGLKSLSCYFELSYLFSLAHCSPSKYDIKLEKCKDIEFSNRGRYEAGQVIQNPNSDMYVIKQRETGDKFLLTQNNQYNTHKLGFCKENSVCPDCNISPDYGYFYYKVLSFDHKLNPKIHSCITYEEKLAKQFALIDQEYQNRR